MGNCVAFALRLWWRRGGYVAWRQSRILSLAPHALWVSADRRHWISYGPTSDYAAAVQAMHPANPLRYLRAMWFRGEVRWGDRSTIPAACPTETVKSGQ